MMDNIDNSLIYNKAVLEPKFSQVINFAYIQ